MLATSAFARSDQDGRRPGTAPRPANLSPRPHGSATPRFPFGLGGLELCSPGVGAIRCSGFGEGIDLPVIRFDAAAFLSGPVQPQPVLPRLARPRGCLEHGGRRRLAARRGNCVGCHKARPNRRTDWNRGRRHGSANAGSNQARCRHRRRGRRRPLCDLSPAPARPDGARLRGRQRRRRHLVLESLSRLPLRRRKPGVFLFVFQRAAAGVAVARALRHPARDPALHQPCRRPLRSQARRSAQHPHPIGPVQQQDQRLDAQDRHGRGDHGAVLHHGDGQPFDAAHTEHSRAEKLQGQMVPHGPVAARGCRFQRPHASASSARGRRGCR